MPQPIAPKFDPEECIVNIALTESTLILTTAFALLFPILTLTLSSLTLIQLHAHAFVRYLLIKQLISKNYIKQHNQVHIRKSCIILMLATGCRVWVLFLHSQQLFDITC